MVHVIFWAGIRFPATEALLATTDAAAMIQAAEAHENIAWRLDHSTFSGDIRALSQAMDEAAARRDAANELRRRAVECGAMMLAAE